MGEARSEDSTRGIDFGRLYEFRFRDVDQASRQAVWSEIALHLHGLMGHPGTVLDPAAGRCEFVNALPGVERWVVDTTDHTDGFSRDPDVKVVISDIRDAPLPADHFEGVLVSNFLEHLESQNAVADVLAHLRRSMAPGGRIAVLGPNFKYCAREYFDCADHELALTHVSVAEHLYAAGFEIDRVIPRYLPYSFRGVLPPIPALTRLYLRMPLAWRLLGKQFLVIGRR
jgi:SAM-dependent methyltransferase